MKTTIPMLHHFAFCTLAAAMVLGAASTALADTWTVTSAGDELDEYGQPQPGTLRWALLSAALVDTTGSPVIVFDPSLNGQNIVVGDGPGGSPYFDFNPDAHLTIQGPGADQLGIVSTGERAITFVEGTITMSDITIGDLHQQQDSGAGIWNEATLSLIDCTIARNVVAADYDSPASAPVRGAGIVNMGTMHIDGCTIAGNAISGDSETFILQGGGIWNFGDMTVRNSTFTNNSSGYGSAIYNDGTMTISDSKLQDNSARVGGGTIYNAGDLTLSNSDLTNNVSTSDGGAIFNEGTMTISGCMIQDNSAETEGGGIYNDGTLAILDSTVSENLSYDARRKRWIMDNLFNTGSLTVTNSDIPSDKTKGGGKGHRK